ncbi:MAG TPA: DUF3775 domain-containing protein [Pseudomonadales bacterium]|nr:DUF3775 domain-containing protein [Pseudomonadales bacterium]
MLSIDLDTVQFIIDKAREFHVKEEVSIPEPPTSPADDWALQVLADHADDATYAELAATIDDLEPDQQVELVALMWLGRGDFEADEWKSAVAAAARARTARTAEYLIATPLLPDYLQEGLALLGYESE